MLAGQLLHLHSAASYRCMACLPCEHDMRRDSQQQDRWPQAGRHFSGFSDIVGGKKFEYRQGIHPRNLLSMVRRGVCKTNCLPLYPLLICSNSESTKKHRMNPCFLLHTYTHPNTSREKTAERTLLEISRTEGMKRWTNRASSAFRGRRYELTTRDCIRCLSSTPPDSPDM